MAKSLEGSAILIFVPFPLFGVLNVNSGSNEPGVSEEHRQTNTKKCRELGKLRNSQEYGQLSYKDKHKK